ncbi:hypothetical protein [Empedobacter falsenii]
MFNTAVFSQVGINTDNPKSTLDISVKNTGGVIDNTQSYGLQAPRLSRADLSAIPETNYGTDQKGAMIYITDISGGVATGQKINVTAIGYYYFDGSVWVKVTDGNTTNTGASTEPWYQSGSTNQATGNGQNIYQSGNIGIRSVSPATALDITGAMGTTDDNVSIRSIGTAGSQAGGIGFERSRGTLTAPATVATGDNLGSLTFSGNDGTNQNIGARIDGVVNGAVSTGVVPTDLTFATGTATNAIREKMRITSDGKVGIGTSAPVQTLDVWGILRVQSITNGAAPLYAPIPPGFYGPIYIANQTMYETGISVKKGSIFKVNTDGDASNNYLGSETTLHAMNGKVGIGLLQDVAKNTLEVLSEVPNTSGLRLTNLESASLLSTDGNGDVIRVANSTIIVGSVYTGSKSVASLISTGSSITLPPGNWLVKVGQMINSTLPGSSVDNMWMNLTLSSENVDGATLPNNNVFGSYANGAISGWLAPAATSSGANSFLEGSFYINIPYTTTTIYPKFSSVEKTTSYSASQSVATQYSTSNYLYAVPMFY